MPRQWAEKGPRGQSGLVRVLFAAAALFAAGATGAAGPEDCERKPKLKPRELQVFIENDIFGGTDRYYTNGLKVGLGAPVVIGDFMKAAREALLGPTPPGRCETVQIGLFLGQNLYTPRSITTSAPQPFDRPWAGWLYLGGVAQTVRNNRLDTLEIDVGIVGPAALGDPVQTGWHKLFGLPLPQGWDHQIRNEPAFLVSYLQKRRFGSGTVDFIPHAGLTIGTVSTLARAGGIVRFGRNMTGFGPDRIEPGGAMLNTTRAELAEEAADWEWYVFGGADLRLVGYNIFLDGSAFRDGPGVDRKPAVHDLIAGLSVRYKALRVSLTRVRRSEEFTTPVGSGGRQTFDSLNVGFEW